MGEYRSTHKMYSGVTSEWRAHEFVPDLHSFGLYDVTVTIGSYTVLVNVGITEEGEIVLRSWQIQ